MCMTSSLQPLITIRHVVNKDWLSSLTLTTSLIWLCNWNKYFFNHRSLTIDKQWIVNDHKTHHNLIHITGDIDEAYHFSWFCQNINEKLGQQLRKLFIFGIKNLQKRDKDKIYITLNSSSLLNIWRTWLYLIATYMCFRSRCCHWWYGLIVTIVMLLLVGMLVLFKA